MNPRGVSLISLKIALPPARTSTQNPIGSHRGRGNGVAVAFARSLEHLVTRSADDWNPFIGVAGGGWHVLSHVCFQARTGHGQSTLSRHSTPASQFVTPHVQFDSHVRYYWHGAVFPS